MKNYPKVKVCGITCRRNLKTFIDMPIDFIGLNFVDRSRRQIKKDKAQRIIEVLPSKIKPVLILEGHDLDDAIKLIKSLKVKHVQLHGNEPSGYCKRLKSRLNGLKIIKVLPMKETTLKQFDEYKNHCDYFLIDSSLGGKMGGTGKKGDWNIARKLVAKSNKLSIPIFLAGGLTPENVHEALEVVKPDYLDVNSGFESKVGYKSKDKLVQLFS